MSKGHSKILYIVVRIIALLGVMLCFGIAIAGSRMTLCPPAIVWAISALTAIILGVMSWRVVAFLTEIDSRFINISIGFIACTCIVCALFYEINEMGVSESDPHVVTRYAIRSLTSETHTRPGRRGARRTSYQTYQAYYEVEGHGIKKIQMSVGEFAKTRKSDSIEVTISTGTFGIPVITSQNIIRFRPPARHNRRFRNG